MEERDQAVLMERVGGGTLREIGERHTGPREGVRDRPRITRGSRGTSTSSCSTA